jgi:hypothetical protein
MNEPAEHLGRSIGAIGSQLLRIKAKALFGTVDHRPGGPDLCLSDGARRFHIKDDRVVDQSDRIAAEALDCPAAGRECSLWFPE